MEQYFSNFIKEDSNRVGHPHTYSQMGQKRSRNQLIYFPGGTDSNRGLQGL
jgi:hypothetical protein